MSVLHAALVADPRARPRVDVERILHPRSVAVFGASDSKDKFGGRIMHFLVRHGFAGDILPINPRRDEVVGRRAYPTIAAAPAPPDVAILAVPGSSLVATVREAAAAGVGCCVIISTGFAEAGTDGAARQAELVRIARETGTRLVGPNCMGLIVPHHRLALCSSVVLDTDRLADGPIGLVSQSGALMVSIFDRAAADGLGFRYGVSLGNQVDLEICDFLDYMVAEPETEALCVYVEGLLDGARFRRSLAAARRAGKPVLVVKTGRTQAGVKSARSHTASLAGAWEVFEAVCREEGAVLAQDPDDMVRAAHFLVRHRAPRRGGVVILSSSGGGCGIASDRVSELGVPLATLTPQSRAQLGELLLPPQADNPVDLGGRRKPEDVEIAGDVARILMNDPGTAYGLVVLTSLGHPQARGERRSAEHPRPRPVHHRHFRRVQGGGLRARARRDGDVRQLARPRLRHQRRPRPPFPAARRDAADVGHAAPRAPVDDAPAGCRHVRQLRRRAPPRRRVDTGGAGRLVADRREAGPAHLRRQPDRPQRGLRRHPRGDVSVLRSGRLARREACATARGRGRRR